jgi:hypothetical protein
VQDTSFPANTGICAGCGDCNNKTEFPPCASTSECPTGSFCASANCGNNLGICLKSCSQP